MHDNMLGLVKAEAISSSDLLRNEALSICWDIVGNPSLLEISNAIGAGS